MSIYKRFPRRSKVDSLINKLCNRLEDRSRLEHILHLYDSLPQKEKLRIKRDLRFMSKWYYEHFGK